MRRTIRALLATVVLTSILAAGPGADPRPAAAATGCNIGTPAGPFSAKVSLSTSHAQVWRLYQAFFLRQPDDQGFGYWTRVRSGGATLGDIAYQFAQGQEFQNRYGNLSHPQFVDLAYTNVLCRTPDQEGRAYWTGLLESGALSRWDMMINFAELREYLNRTQTCHSIYPAESAAVSSCPQSGLVPQTQADLGANGYREKTVSIGGRTFRATEVDLAAGVFETGTERCSVASINGNWMPGSQKDGPNPDVLGVGVVDGIHVKGSADRSDRGVFGLRFDPSPVDVTEVWPGDTLSPDDTRLSSVAWSNGTASVENWHAAAELSPYLSQLKPQEIVDPSEWVWAAAGIPLRIDGQTDTDLGSDFARDPYTYGAGAGHPFVAVDNDTGRLVFGAISGLHVQHLVAWAEAGGYEDLIKFDGGGSVEYNIAGQAVVAGTSRDVPVWLGIGC
jgi:hypothetical protein